MFSRSLLFSSLFNLFTLSIAQNDPIEHFCRRHGHQSAVVDNKLYVDGGLVNYKPFGADSRNYTSGRFPSCL